VNSAFVISDDGDEALTRLASRVEAFAVINRHWRAEPGRSSILINSCNQSSAESSACSDPNDWVTALKNADKLPLRHCDEVGATGVGLCRRFVMNDWIHIPHLSKPEDRENLY